MSEKMTSGLSYNQRRILAELSNKPMTKVELMAALELTDSPVVINLRKLKEKGIVYQCGEQVRPGMRAGPLYTTKTKWPSVQMDDHKASTGLSSQRLDSIKSAIRDLGWRATCPEIADWLDVPEYLIDSAVSYYRKAGASTETFYIAGWARLDGRGFFRPQYAIGPGQDAPRPVRSQNEYKAEWRARNRAISLVAHAKQRAKVGHNVAVLVNPFAQLLNAVGAQAHGNHMVPRKKDAA